MRYMLDTNICVYLIRRRSATLAQKLAHFSAAEITISSVTVAELEFGVQKSSQPAQNRQALDLFLAPFTVVEFDREAATAYGSIRAHLEAQGMPIGSLDNLVAAHALSLGLTLVTNNTREFSRVPGLMVEDWTSS
jgi:tRNA(fMet)-specific endonuclease VapC